MSIIPPAALHRRASIILAEWVVHLIYASFREVWISVSFHCDDNVIVELSECFMVLYLSFMLTVTGYADSVKEQLREPNFIYTAGIDFKIKWAASWKKQQQNVWAPSEDSDQPGRPPSLIRVFAVRVKKPWVRSYTLSAHRRLWSDWADSQADLSLRWADISFCCFCHETGHVIPRLYFVIAFNSLIWMAIASALFE